MTWFWCKDTETTEEPTLVKELNELPEISKEIQETTPDVSIPEDVKEQLEGENVVSGMGFVSGQTFVAEKKAHSGLVNLLQDKYGKGITGGSSKGCNVETEILKSVNGGLVALDNKHSSMQGSIKQTLTNLMVLKEFLDSGYEKVLSIGYECGDDMVKEQLKEVKQIHKAVLAEVEHQIKVLTSLLKVTVEPTSKNLSELINKNKDYMKVMELLANNDYGTKEASDRLALAFNGITQTGQIKTQMQKALKEIGMSEKEFKSTKNLSELRKKLYTTLKKLASSKVEGEKMQNIFQAMKALEQNFVNKDKLGGMTTFGSMMKEAEKEFGMKSKSGGVPSRTSVQKPSSLTKRIENKQKTTKEIMKSFIKDVNLRFNSIKDSIDEVAPKIGSTIPYGKSVKDFINAYSRFSELNKENIYFALIEFDTSNASFKQMKVEFLDDLDIISKSLTSLVKGPQGSYFNNIKQNITALLEVVATYTSVLHGVQSAKVTGGACSKAKTLKDDRELTTSSVNLIKSTVNKLQFYGKIAVIRENLSCISKEHENYQQGYDKMLGKAIGEELSRINKSYQDASKFIESNKVDNKDDLLGVLNYDKDARVGLYKTIEAIDLYLMNFSDAIAKNPQAVNDLEKMMQSTQLIAQWFVQKSGDNFKSLFELKSTTDEALYESCKQAFESISVLKNVISMFIHIGEKFGSAKLQDKIHMSPNTIYKNLVKYVWVSAIDKNIITKFMPSELSEDSQQTMDFLNKRSSLKSITQYDPESDTDDQYFVLTVKSVMAKVLTVVGTYSIFKKPEKPEHMITNPVRLILGGNDSTPEIMDGAIELYIRLPLLVEFYKSIFDDGNQKYKDNANNSENNDTDIIAFIPEMGSLWSGLIKIIFDNSKFISTQDLYSLQNMKDIIREINKIFKHYQGKDNVVRLAFCGLIAEINRRYGILKKCDVVQYYQLQKQQQVSYLPNDPELYTNFDILNDNDERDNAGPSAVYTTEQLKTLEFPSSIKTHDRKLILEFRQRVNNMLSNTEVLETIANYSFEERIRFYQQELKSMSSNEKKFELVVKAIEQSNDTAQNNVESYILFHELVIAPCNAMSVLYDLCEKFSSAINKNDELEIVDALELLYTFTSDMEGLVEMKLLAKEKLVISYEKLQAKITGMVENVKYMISKFRNTIDAGLLAKFEDPKQEGSVYYLENILLNHFIKNSLYDTLTENDAEQKNKLANVITFDQLIPKLNKLFSNYLPSSDTKLFSLIAWNSEASDAQSLSLTGPMNDAFMKYNNKDKVWESLSNGKAGPMAKLTKISNMFSLDGGFSSDKGMLSRFNQLLYNYLNEFYDKSTKKIYSKLFLNTAEQTFSYAVYGKGIADMDDVKLSNALPKNNIVLCSSIAYTMKKLLTRTLNPQLPQKYHSLSELVEVSPHMVEEYRAKLPAFMKLFTLLQNKCVLFKSMLENEDIVDLDTTDVLPAVMTALSSVDDDGTALDIFQEFEDSMAGQSKSDRFTNYKQILANIIEGCNSIMGDAKLVMDEVKAMDGQETLFFELKLNFIKEYYGMTKNLPFMPASTLLYSLQNNKVMLPNSKLHTPEFKFLYGASSVLNGKKYSLKQMPYMQELINKFNTSVQTGYQLDMKNCESVLEQLVSFTKFSADITQYKNLFSMQVLQHELSKPSTYSMYNPLSSIIDLTQNTFLENNKEKFINYTKNLSQSMGGTDIMQQNERKYARVLNIIDVNVVPINIHALMREVPLANIYNYSISYDHMIEKEITSNDTSSMLFRDLLKNPYADLSAYPSQAMNDVFNGSIQSLNMSKPRFLSDQLWTKCEVSNLTNGKINTKIVRDTTWFVNIQRLLSRKIRNELYEIKTKVVEDNKISSSQLTDYDGEHSSLNEEEFNFSF